ncbi:MAG TPA: alpha/beta hydrolase [Anaerolineales bacterium]
MNHRFIETNGITMHIAEQGEGRLVVLCHGFPECWYSWRHQLPALADAGYHAVAPDQRGFGQTDQPEPIEAYHILQSTSDIVGLVQALGEEQAVIAGHDWGAHVARHCALLRPDIFRAVILLSVPFVLRSWTDPRPTEWMKQLSGDKEFYILHYQEPGKAEAEMEADVRKTLWTTFVSESLSPEKRGSWLFNKSEKYVGPFIKPDVFPDWFTEQDLDYYTREFERTGFRGGLNWYRNYDRNWELTPFLAGAKLRQPTLFVTGEYDGVLAIRRAAFNILEETVLNLWKKVVLAGAGHWIQQERPAEVNQLLIEFLASLSEK